MASRRVLVLLAAAVLASACSSLIDVEMAELDVEQVDVPVQTQVLAADGSTVATLRVAHRELVTRDDLPETLVAAVVAAEDRRFYEHDGVDFRAIARATLANQRAGEVVQGGSTITQQLVKNRHFPDAEETVGRKIAEARLARELERTTSKDDVLVDYLNTVYLGAGAYGVQAAARTYFNSDVDALDLPQAALLAGLIRAPEASSPHREPQRARDERSRVLNAMAETGAVTTAAADAAHTAALGVSDQLPTPVTRYPYAVEHAKRTLLGDPDFGPDGPARRQRLYGGGLRVHLTIEPTIQGAAERASTTYWSAPGDPEVAIAVVRPADGHVVAAVGGRDFSASPFDLATQARRQPGSTFKTFGLVAALREGWRLDDELEAGPATLDLGHETWSVRSASRGRMDLREATAVSSNGAFARLAIDLGGQRIADQARLMGITSEVGTNPAIVLGGLREGVSPLEMAAAYGTLANAGVHERTTVVSHVTDTDGRVVWSAPEASTAAMDGETAWLTTQALIEAIENGTGRAARLDRPAAGKTGTVQEHRDAWFVGFTPQLSAAVWIGYPDAARPLRGVHGVAQVSGGTWPARIWQALMADALAGEPVEPFPYPQHQEVTITIDPSTGYRATDYCPVIEEVTGLPGELPRYSCPVHRSPPPTAEPEPEATDPPEATEEPEPTPTATAEPGD